MPNRDLTYYEELWESMSYQDHLNFDIQMESSKVTKHKDSYELVETTFNKEIPWFVIGIIHLMEADCNFSLNLHNGQPYNKKTTLVPKGRGPFESWEASAYDALNMKKDLFPDVWDIGHIGDFFERYNGMGYMYKGVNSPYLWSFSNHGVSSGKYVEDGKYDPDSVSKQVGAMVILKEMVDQGKVIIADKIFNYAILPYMCKDKAISKIHQQALNDIMYQLNESERLVVDGIPGKKTSYLNLHIFGKYLEGDPRDR